YPSGGNYWDDYAGTDQFFGPNQNESGPDDIGDLPYVIDTNSQDNYPLMSPPGDLPSAPENLQATWGDSFVNITWSPPSSDGGFPVTKYRIYRGTVSGGETFLVDTQWFAYYNDTVVTNGVRYYYRVAAINNKGEGPKSNEAASIPTAVPGPPTGLQASLGGDDWEKVTVNWSLSIDDGMGQSSVVEYKVFRGLNYSSNGDGYALIGVLPNGTFEYWDVSAGEGDPNNYFYRVCAVDVNGKTNCTVDQVGKFTRVLAKGLNVVSVPLVAENMCTDEILQSVSYDRVWLYDASEGAWKGHMMSKPHSGEFCDLNRTIGLWINVTRISNLTVAGLVPTATTIELKAGWNLVGFPFFEQDHNVSYLFEEMAVDLVEGFDESASPYFLRTLEADELLLPGRAYWVRASVDVQLTVLNS
ncbi:MAG: fibronectin type III domain-containing protein, partial [Thermoplasmata archaeon]|nr:fibronectin type III domain-containing protein [Thermoplasmata archaeon]